MLGLQVGESASVSWVVHNDGGAARSIPYRVEELSGDWDPSERNMWLNGLAPGTPVTGTVSVGAHDSVAVSATAQFTRYQPFNPHELLWSMDSNGDGVLEKTSARGLITVPGAGTSGVGSPEPGAEAVPGPVAAATLDVSPNPFRGATEVRLGLPHGAGSADLAVYDAAGRRVRTLHAGALASGAHLFRWDGRDEGGQAGAAGIYFVRARIAGRTLARKFVRME